MFASNFIVDDKYLRHVRGKEKLSVFEQNKSIASGKKMANHFCSNCGTLMYRVGERWPGKSIMRIGTVDDFALHETKLKPRTEIFVKDRVSWLSGIEGAEPLQGGI